MTSRTPGFALFPVTVCRDKVHGSKCSPSFCSFHVHPTQLYRLICRKCSYVKHLNSGIQQEKNLYKDLRRLTRKELGLMSLSAPLDGESAEDLRKICRRLGIQTNTTVVHVTLLEGIRPDPTLRERYVPALMKIRQVLQNRSYWTVANIRKESQTGNNDRDLIMANFIPGPPMERALQEFRQIFAHTGEPSVTMPSFVFHVSLGTIAKRNANTTIHKLTINLARTNVCMSNGTLKVLSPKYFHFDNVGQEKAQKRAQKEADFLNKALKHVHTGCSLVSVSLTLDFGTSSNMVQSWYDATGLIRHDPMTIKFVDGLLVDPSLQVDYMSALRKLKNSVARNPFASVGKIGRLRNYDQMEEIVAYIKLEPPIKAAITVLKKAGAIVPAIPPHVSLGIVAARSATNIIQKLQYQMEHMSVRLNAQFIQVVPSSSQLYPVSGQSRALTIASSEATQLTNALLVYNSPPPGWTGMNPYSSMQPDGMVFY